MRAIREPCPKGTRITCAVGPSRPVGGREDDPRAEVECHHEGGRPHHASLLGLCWVRRVGAQGSSQACQQEPTTATDPEEPVELEEEERIEMDEPRGRGRERDGPGEQPPGHSRPRMSWIVCWRASSSGQREEAGPLEAKLAGLRTGSRGLERPRCWLLPRQSQSIGAPGRVMWLRLCRKPCGHERGRPRTWMEMEHRATSWTMMSLWRCHGILRAWW